LDRVSTPGGSTEARTRLASDADLVAALRGGDEAAFEHLLRTYGGRLLAVTRRLLGNEEDARDAVQETFLRAFRSLGSFEGGSLLSTWLHRIAVNTALMRLRSRKRKPEEPIESLLPAFREDGHFSERFQAWTEPPDDEAARREREVLVRQAIDRLPEHYRTVLLLRDIEELSTTDVAEQLGVTTNAVKLRLHRARQALRTLLAPQFRSPAR
jgi:RNA polymerase sigma-70 factor (ECF subfamily)